ncbi:OmpA family protein [Prosthecobacter debontii]|uniref:OmpA family protein n=2 Tax=Prosthecobacter debontii TaxID=48467 RepID=A0A1T4XH79_9BACT|nr:OmpA family protein [Prosthecobacter debontii]
MDAMRHPFLLSSFASALVLGLSSCQQMPPLFPEDQADIVFALGARDGFVSPLTTSLKPACSALEFEGNSFSLKGAHRKTLSELSKDWSSSKPRYLVAGYTQPDLPEDYARSLSERRAQAVRQALIESGVEATHLQTVGFGHDSAPSGPTTGVVVIYRQ